MPSRPAPAAAPAEACRRATRPIANPVSEVNIACANGDSTARTMNVTPSCSPPPSMRLMAKYWMFSVNAKPAPTSAP